jgi:hypothetical protein
MTASALAQSATLRANRPDRIERVAQGKSALGRHALPARLEADKAAERRRNAHRAAGIAADGDVAHAVGDGDRRARRGAAGHARAVARIAGRAEMRIGADSGKGELGHVGLGDDHRARRAQPAHDRASAAAGAASSARIFEPARVGSPATSNKSLMLTIAPSSGPSETPCATRASAASAAARAGSA